MGIDIYFGDPADEIPGKNIVLPQDTSFIKAKEVDLDHARSSLIRNSLKDHKHLGLDDIEFLAAETKLSIEDIKAKLKELEVTWRNNG
jgi:hypothetical protein